MPPVATLISRVAARYLGVGAGAAARELARVAARHARTAAAARTPPAPLPPAPPPGLVARGVFGLWLLGLALFALVVFNVDLFLPGGVADRLRLAIGVVLLSEGVGLLLRRSPLRAIVLARLTAGSSRHPSKMRRAAWKHGVGAGLTILGLVWVGAGVLDLLRGAIALSD